MSGINIYLSSFTDKALIAYKALHPESEMNILLSYGTRKNDYKNMVIRHYTDFKNLEL
ncbi:MAG: hypothetical protein HQK63_10755 [Desulfamplus sp.]|nr:hypothetical protein [Desulfamplus sp.]